MKHIAQQIHNHILQAQKIVVIPHQNPDGDALGAAGALYEYLLGLPKPAAIFCVTSINPKLHFIPHSATVQLDPRVLQDKEVDTVILVDSGDLRYAGVDAYLGGHPATIINIDHHATNEKYGYFNLVDSTAASTTEILFHYFRHNNIRLNQRLATALLTGLTTDTGNFTNAATSATALAAGSELLRHGANLKLITEATLRDKSVEVLRLWGKVLGRLEKHEALNLAYTYITQQDLRDHNVNETESEGIANFLNNLENAKIALILKELPDGKVKGSFRTTHDDVDVAKMAKQLGGGGHKKAAGFTIEGNVQEVLQKIWNLEKNEV